MGMRFLSFEKMKLFVVRLSVRQKLVTEARERRCSGRGLTLQQKSQTTSIFAILRKELAEDESIKNTVRKVLTRTPKEPRELESGGEHTVQTGNDI